MPSRAKFPYHLPYDRLNLRKHPELYRPAKGEQGVLMVQPYKAEMVPLWKFKTPDIARTSSAALRERFHAYLDESDFVGADLCLKFIRMGYTRARRYANHTGGKKYRILSSDEEAPKHTKVKRTTNARGKAQRKIELPRGAEDPVKAESARIFQVIWDEERQDEKYLSLLTEHLERYDANPLPDGQDLEALLEPKDWLESQ